MSKATETALKLLESLPEEAQEYIVEELRQLVQEAQDEARWNDLFKRNKGLSEAAVKAQQEIAAGKATDMGFERL